METCYNQCPTQALPNADVKDNWEMEKKTIISADRLRSKNGWRPDR